MESLVVGAITLALMGAALPQGPGPGTTGQPHWQFGANDTPGWALMSDAERAGHHSRIMSLRTYAECRTYVVGRHRAMQARANERGQALPDAPRNDVCQRMSRAGRLK